ncbi:MAG: hypothetical protein E7574_00110 [Ruminococcaceae bacterium]|nr:hypothetical protein [Oscillospiraceae bacterium]
MDNEKINGLELNTPNEAIEANESPITADDLIKKLKTNLKQNPNLQGEDIFESSENEEVSASNVAETEEAADEADFVSEEQDTAAEDDEYFKAWEESFQKILDEEIPSLEEVAEPVEEEKPKERTSITDSVKSLIASLKANVMGSDKEEAVSETVEVKPEAEENEPEENEAVVEETPAEETVASETVAEETAASEKEYSVVIGNASDKTAVFDPMQLKQTKKSDDTESLFEENEQPAVAEAEQLTFSMTEDDLQKSIEEAEAFIFDREYISNPEEVINDEILNEYDMSGENGQAEEFDQTDLWIASAFGDEDELKDKFGDAIAQEVETQLDIEVNDYLKEQKKTINNAKISEEYTSQSQAKDIFARYRKLHKRGLMKMAACFILVFVAFLYENITAFGGSLPGALSANNYPVVYILGSLQLLVLAAGIAWEELYRGVQALFTLRPLPESLTSAMVIVSAIYHIAHCFISETDPTVALYVFPVIVCIFVTLVYDFFNLKREIYSFNIVASKRLKYTITKVEDGSADLENEAFGAYLSEEDDVSMFKIGKTGFVKGFYERMNCYSKFNSIVSILLSVAVALGLIFFIIATVLHDVKSGFSFGYLAFVLAVPACSLLGFGLPFYRASKKAFDDDSAIIGCESLEEYSRANTLSFDDKDVFPSYGVKVKSIKVYGESRIDKILYNAASVFKLIGGPLADVFDTATHDLGNSENIEIIEISKDGIESIIDGQHVYIGKCSYLKARGYSPAVEVSDEHLETSGEASIMYMVCDDEISAKMYVQYTIDPDFEFALRKLYKAGICIGIKTFDPNIDDKLLGSKVNIAKYPVRILRCSSLEEKTATQDEADSGIVTKGSPRSLLNTFVLCAKVLYANRTNVTVKIISVLFSVLLMAFLLVLGKVTSIPSIYVVLYQLFWMIPVYLISKFYV